MDFGGLIQKVENLILDPEYQPHIDKLNEIKGLIQEAQKLPGEEFDKVLPEGWGGQGNPIFTFCDPGLEAITVRKFIEAVNLKLDVPTPGDLFPPMPEETSDQP